MAVDFTVNANVDRALNELKKLEDQISKVGEKFAVLDRLNTSVLALGASFLAAGAAVAAFADDISDIADANQLAVGQVLALSKALQESGGKAENTGRLLQALSNNVEEVNAGNVKSLSSFQRLGVSIQDLGSLSTSELKDKLLNGLVAIKDPMERNALAAQMFGKALLGVDIEKFAASQKDLETEMAKYESSIRAAGDAWDNIAKIVGQLKLAFAQAFEPLFKYFAQIKIDTDALVIGFRLMAAALVVMTGAAVIGGLLKLVEIMKTLNAVVSKNKLITIVGLLASLGIGAASYLGLTKDIDEAQGKITDSTKGTNDQVQKGKRDQQGLADALQKQKDTLTQIRDNLERNWKNTLARFNLEKDLLLLGEEEKKVAEARGKVEEETQNALLQLKQKYEALDVAGRARQAQAYKDEKTAIEQNAVAQKDAAEQSIRDTARRKQAIEDLVKSFSPWTQATGDILQNEAKLALSVEGNVYNRIKLEAQVNEVMKRRQIISDQLSKLAPGEQLSINQALNNATAETSTLIGTTDDLGRAFDDAFRKQIRGAGLSRSAFLQVTEGIAGQNQAISGSTEIFVNAQQQIVATSRQFEVGWKQAFNGYVESANNSAEQAKQIFQRLTSGLEDLFVNFVKTGKLSFKDLVNTMIEEMARIQFRKMASILSGGGGGGGLFGGSIVPGFLAEGGPAIANKPYIVGEKGPELFVPKGSGTVIPNSALGSGGFGGAVTYNINAVDAMSFKEMIARDPGFIYAVTQQGARSVPGGR
jgi:lambda family phage tail tape measure protein